eukprot:11523537-Alexandrium_andersonii.AAC.1
MCCSFSERSACSAQVRAAAAQAHQGVLRLPAMSIGSATSCDLWFHAPPPPSSPSCSIGHQHVGALVAPLWPSRPVDK